MIGLAKAIVRFDPDLGFKFTTFAAPTIRGELKKWLRSSAWAVHVPRGLQELALHARRAFTEVSQNIGHEASIEELSVAVGAIQPESKSAACSTFTASAPPRAN